VTLAVQAFWLPKAGNTADEYEDAFAYSVAAGCFAVADGATDSAFAGRWAQSLVRRFAAAPPPLSPPSRRAFRTWLAPLQGAWHAGIDWPRLPWYGVEKARAGAFSALVGLTLVGGAAPPHASPAAPSPAGARRWHALAVGDSCLFHVRDDTLLAAFPLQRAEQFSIRPVLLSSNPANNRRVWEAVWLGDGTWQPEDLFFLATDALAHWFLAQHEAGAKPWGTLGALQTDADFAACIAALRQERRLRNDDVTLLTVRPRCPEAPSAASRSATEALGVEEGKARHDLA
jgi:hypothetical protein